MSKVVKQTLICRIRPYHGYNWNKTIFYLKWSLVLKTIMRVISFTNVGYKTCLRTQKYLSHF